ncbi:V-type ATP synthase subunit I [Natranaeroarchaeum aerophilus]|uniref:A-type ATP synthase subunit I n=1 Tax=Natranaeroarchaeum aerophilus TaxID=2917711 RepID=A0AAE3FNB8_9EURY|nr:V-type ATP synthase subunit I [Natranaeroarchaeum aerophilus]MCL9812642.1 V-type ATP synthase subunit I [Natranaeroarchaeum aerophilus]
MLRPEQMSKVSVAGSRSVMEPVIETVHGMNLVHLSDYDGSWEGFDNGDPIEGSEQASEKLVTVRALESILDIENDDAGPSRIVTREEIDDELPGIREDVNALDDRRDEIRDELRTVDERIGSIEPFVDLGIELDLLGGYDSLEVRIGQGNVDEIEAALDDEESVDAYETFTGDDVVAVFAHPADGAEHVIDDALVGVEFSTYEVPESDRAPEEFLAELREQKRELQAQRDQIQTEIDELREEVGGFLLAAEEKLSIDVQRSEAPLQFATSKRAFIAEGWIPTDRYDEFESELRDAVGDSLEIEELVVAEYDDHGHATHAEEVDHDDEESATAQPDEEEAPPKAATDGGHSTGSAAAAGGGVAMMNDAPPVVQDNPDITEPFEMLVNTVSRPSYSELDPTVLVFLTFPFAFGFMIGDIGYGILYGVMGYALLRYDSMAMQAMGAIAIWSGVFTVLFGYLYDDVFGVHMSDVGINLPLAGIISKGLDEAYVAYVDLWLVVAVLFGIAMLSAGWIIGFVNDLNHGVKEAALENLSWVVALNGFFAWVFSMHLADAKPDFLVGENAALVDPGLPILPAITGLPEIVGLAGLGLFVVGLVGIGLGEGLLGLVEVFANLFGHTLSFLRIPAVLLAKGGMAFAVNVLVFGQYIDDGTEMFGLPTEDLSTMETGFVGLLHIDAVPFLLVLPIAILVFAVGHFFVLLLGITSAGIQMVRLEYVEFFQKFYEGGGERYEPFGYDRNHTTQD